MSGPKKPGRSYATSISVLYYLSKISVEPIMVFFLLYNIIFLKKGLDENNYNLFYLFSAGCFTAFNFYTKINMMGIMPFVSVAYISMVCWNNAYRPFLKKFILFYSFGFILIFISFLPFTNWTFFFATWASQNIAPPPDNSQSVLKSFLIVFSKFYDMLINLSSSFSKLNFSFDNTIQGVFNRIEYLYILISFVGLLIYFFKRTIQKEIWILVTVSAWCAFLWWYRGTTKMLLTWHYLYINVLLLSLGFGYLVEFFCKSFRLKSITLCTSLLIIAIVFLHHASIYTYLDSRAYDIKQYNAYPSLFFKVMHSINSTDKVAALCQKGNNFNSASIFHCLDCSYTDGKQPRLLMNIPITAMSIENFKSNADILAQLSASGYTHYLDFTRGFSTNTEFHRLSNIANANIF